MAGAVNLAAGDSDRFEPLEPRLGAIAMIATPRMIHEAFNWSATMADARFSESHEWFAVDGDTVTIGISKFAADELTDITYVELREAGTTIEAGETVGEVESVKTTSDVYSAVGGEIIAVNEAIIENPALLNDDPQGEGWLVRIRTSDAAPLNELLDQATYDEQHPVG